MHKLTLAALAAVPALGLVVTHGAMLGTNIVWR